MPKDRKRVAINQSALFKITSAGMLGKVLLAEPALLRTLSKSDNYLRFEKAGRHIEEPKPTLKRIHRRFADLLGQLEIPSYLHSAIKRRRARSLVVERRAIARRLRQRSWGR